MNHAARTRGIGTKETLLALGVILVFAAVLIPLLLRSRNKNLLLEESGKMRRIYVAFTFYGEQWDGQPPLNLVATIPILGDKLALVSTEDPFADTKANSYPVDAGIDNFESSKSRISFSYIEDFRRAGKLKIAPWKDMQVDAITGVLADEWLGTIQPGQPFKAQVSGRLLRINMDGSVTLINDRGGPKPLGDSQDLFIRR